MTLSHGAEPPLELLPVLPQCRHDGSSMMAVFLFVGFNDFGLLFDRVLFSHKEGSFCILRIRLGQQLCVQDVPFTGDHSGQTSTGGGKHVVAKIGEIVQHFVEASRFDDPEHRHTARAHGCCASAFQQYCHVP